jgi:GMP reductase
MKRALHYKDICLVPRFNTLSSRSEADTTVDFLGKRYKLPVVPSNMKCVIDSVRASWLSENGYFYIMHRFGDTYAFVKDNQHLEDVSISVGVKGSDVDLLKKIKSNGLRVDVITIDIAHGHSLAMRGMIDIIHTLFPHVSIIAGNVCTEEAVKDLHQWGADCIKVGIGGGAPCSTKNKTGFTLPMYTCLTSIKPHRYGVPIIADGGVREHADIAKAIHAGATMVMAGSLFSKLIDSPAEIVNGHKVYYGSASQFNKGEYKHVEGVKRTLDVDLMTYAEKLNEIEQDLQSAISYAGGESLYDIREAKTYKVTNWEA